MTPSLRSSSRGFTIIEVLIVLAIAGVIMLIVFLAAPALLRNTRNTQRTNDAALIVSAVNECLSNRNGQVASCNNPAAASLNTFLDTTKLGQLTGVTTGNTAGTVSAAVIQFSARCDTAGAGVLTGAGIGARNFVVRFQLETTGTTGADRCVEG